MVSVKMKHGGAPLPAKLVPEPCKQLCIYIQIELIWSREIRTSNTEPSVYIAAIVYIH